MWTRILRLVACALVVAVVTPGYAFSEVTEPVVVVPGILGSKLCAIGKPDEVVWGDVGSLSDFHRLKLAVDPQDSVEAMEPCGIIEGIQVLGPFEMDQYRDLIQTLEGVGYKQGETLFIFDYDWRLDLAESARRLDAFVEAHIPDGQFDIVAHSMGGLISRLYISGYDTKAQVRRLVEMGTPHQGSVTTLDAAFNGWDWWKNALAGGLGEVRATLLTFPSIYQLLPRYEACCWIDGATPTRFNAFDPKVWERFSWLPASLRTPSGSAMLTRYLHMAEANSDAVQEPLPKSVEFIPIVAGVIITKWKVYVDAASGDLARWDTYYGDGTVYEWSAADGRMSLARFSDTEHGRIFANEAARSTLRWALVSDTEPKSGDAESKARGVIRATDGSAVPIVGLDLEITPSLPMAGEAATATVIVRAVDEIGAAQFAAEARLVAGTARLTLSSEPVDPALPQELRYTATFTPAAAGTEVLEVSIPGLAAPVQQPFIVLSRQ